MQLAAVCRMPAGEGLMLFSRRIWRNEQISLPDASLQVVAIQQKKGSACIIFQIMRKAEKEEQTRRSNTREKEGKPLMNDRNARYLRQRFPGAVIVHYRLTFFFSRIWAPGLLFFFRFSAGSDSALLPSRVLLIFGIAFGLSLFDCFIPNSDQNPSFSKWAGLWSLLHHIPPNALPGPLARRGLAASAPYYCTVGCSK